MTVSTGTQISIKPNNNEFDGVAISTVSLI